MPTVEKIRELARGRNCTQLCEVLPGNLDRIRKHLMEHCPDVWQECKRLGLSQQRSRSPKAVRNMLDRQARKWLNKKPTVASAKFHTRIIRNGRTYIGITGCRRDDAATIAAIEAKGGVRI